MRLLRGFCWAAMLAALWIIPASAQQGITGVWRGNAMAPWGQPMAMEVIFMPNGTYTAAAQAGTLMTRHWGRFEVVQNWIHFYIQGAAPREYCGPQRCIPLAWPNSETWVVTGYDGRVLTTANARLERVQ